MAEIKHDITKRVGMSACRHVGMSACRHVGVLPGSANLAHSDLVAVHTLSCIGIASWRLDNWHDSACQRAGAGR